MLMVVERPRPQYSHLTGENRPNRSWTPEILAGVIVSLKESGRPINPGYLLLTYKRAYEAMSNLPGGWRRVVELAGYDPQKEARSTFGPERRFRPKSDDGQ